MFGGSGSNRAQVVVFGQSCCILVKEVVFGKVVVFEQKWLFSSKSGCIRAQVVVFVQSGCKWAKVAVFE